MPPPVIAAAIASAGALGAAKINSNAQKAASAAGNPSTGSPAEKPGDAAWKAAAVNGAFQIGAAFLNSRASGKAAAAGSAAEQAQLEFVREQWEEQKKRDAAALEQENARYQANEERLAPYRGASDALLRQQAERLGLPVPERKPAAAPADPRGKPVGYDRHGRTIYDTQGVSAQPAEYMEAKTSPNAYSVPEAQTLGELAKLEGMMADPEEQGGLTLEDIMALSRSPRASAFSGGGAFRRSR